MYYLGRDHGIEGWSLEPCETLEELKQKIINETYGNSWKIFKDLDFKIIEDKNEI